MRGSTSGEGWTTEGTQNGWDIDDSCRTGLGIAAGFAAFVLGVVIIKNNADTQRPTCGADQPVVVRASAEAITGTSTIDRRFSVPKEAATDVDCGSTQQAPAVRQESE
jgi:hypothetical protein